MRAIAIYESLFSDPITIQILFRYSDTPPSPAAHAPVLFRQAFSQQVFRPFTTISWNDFISALRADATTSNDNIANRQSAREPVIYKHRAI